MYAFLQGKLAHSRPGRAVVDCGGVGYDVQVPVGARLPAEGERVHLWTHLVVRDDAHLLFGFPEVEQRAVFRMLLSVRGVGPGMAMSVLSRLPGAALLEVVAQADLGALTAIKGVGKKTAEQILLDLRDKVPAAEAGLGADGVLTPASSSPAQVDDAVAALLSIGYAPKEAQSRVDRAARRVDPQDLELLVRTALEGG